MFYIQDEESIKKEIESSFKDFLRIYFLEKDTDMALSLISPKISGFGFDEMISASYPIEDIVSKAFIDADKPAYFQIGDIHTTIINFNTGIINATLALKCSENADNFPMYNIRISMIYMKTEDKWYILHIHMSLPSKSPKNLSMPVSDEAPIKTNIGELKGVIPVCASCRKIRDDWGLWYSLEDFIKDNTNASVSHGLCPDCAKSVCSSI